MARLTLIITAILFFQKPLFAQNCDRILETGARITVHSKKDIVDGLLSFIGSYRSNEAPTNTPLDLYAIIPTDAGPVALELNGSDNNGERLMSERVGEIIQTYKIDFSKDVDINILRDKVYEEWGLCQSRAPVKAIFDVTGKSLVISITVDPKIRITNGLHCFVTEGSWPSADIVANRVPAGTGGDLTFKAIYNMKDPTNDVQLTLLPPGFHAVTFNKKGAAHHKFALWLDQATNTVEDAREIFENFDATQRAKEILGGFEIYRLTKKEYYVLGGIGLSKEALTEKMKDLDLYYAQPAHDGPNTPVKRKIVDIGCQANQGNEYLLTDKGYRQSGADTMLPPAIRNCDTPHKILQKKN